MRHLSLLLRAFFPSPGVAGAPTCKYHPTCSEYAAGALRKHGPVKGSAKAAWRLLRCNPWSGGGVDYPWAGSEAGGARPENRGTEGASGHLR